MNLQILTRVRTFIWYFAGWALLVLTWPFLLWAKYLDWMGKLSKRDSFADNFTRWLCFMLVKLSGSSVEVSGLENIPQDDPVLFVCNHQGHFDSAIVHGYIPKPKGFISIVEVLRFPIIRTWMKYMQCVFMDRSDIKQSLKCINQGVEFLKQGHSMVIYPEGRIVEGELIGEFKRGSLKMALKGEVPIVPVTIMGSNDVMNKNGSIVKAAKVRCIVSPCILTRALSRDERNNLAETVRNVIAENLIKFNIHD